MKRRFFRTAVSGLLFGICMCLGACGDSGLLDEIPREFSLFSLPVSDADAQSGAEESESGQQEEQLWFLEEGCSEYAAQCLNGAELLWYAQIRDALGGHAEAVELDGQGMEAGLDEEDVGRIFQCVLNDHPELFFVEGYAYTKLMRGEETVSIEFMGTYTMEAQTAAEKRKELTAAVSDILSEAAAAAGEYERVKYVYETLIRETEYDQAAPDNQNILSVFLNHRSVCQGYAKATQYLLERLGVACTLVTGSVGTGETHAWNLVRVDGTYYYLDTTWGDASYYSETGTETWEGERPQISYDYLNVTTEELLRTHTPAETVPLPLCTADAANYYVREDAYFAAYDRERLQTLFAKRAGEGKEVSLKCADAACYGEMLERLIDGQEIFLCLNVEDGQTLAYTRNDTQLSLSFWVTNE